MEESNVPVNININLLRTDFPLRRPVCPNPLTPRARSGLRKDAVWTGAKRGGREGAQERRIARRAGAAQGDYIVALLSAGSFILSTNTIPPTDSSAFTIQQGGPSEETHFVLALLNQQT